MKRKLVRYPLALLCLILGGYCFLREPSPVWTIETKNANVLGFTPDGQSLWTYGCDESKDPSLITFQRYGLAAGNVLGEHQVHLDIADQGHIVDMSADAKMAYIKVPQVRGEGKYNTQDLLIDLTHGNVRKLPSSGPDSGPGRYSMSPTGKWLSHFDRAKAIVIDQQSTEIVLTLEKEVGAEGKYWMPFNISFSSDETHLAVAWNHNDGKGAITSSEIRFYDAAVWKEQSRVTIPQAGYCNLDGWHEDQLWYTISGKGDEALHESLFYFYRLNTSVPFSDLEVSSAQLIATGYLRNYANPNYVREYRLVLNHGADWHVWKNFRESYQSLWIESCRNKPIISVLINQLWPREAIALEFHQTSSQQKFNRISLKPDSHYCISRDGQWIAGLLNYKDQVDLYSTAPLMRWPGYVFVLAGILILFWRRPKRTLLHGPAELR